MPTRECNLEKLREELKVRRDWRKRHPVRTFFLVTIPKYCWYRVPDYISDSIRKVRRGIQRGYNGWCDEDLWGLHSYLNDVFIGSLKKLKKVKHGCPCIEGYDHETDHGFEAMQEEWERILDNIIWTFETAKRIDEQNLIYPHGEDYFTDKELKKWKKLSNSMIKDGFDGYQIMTKEEVDRYRQGWKYLQQYWFNLWD